MSRLDLARTRYRVTGWSARGSAPEGEVRERVLADAPDVLRDLARPAGSNRGPARRHWGYREAIAAWLLLVVSGMGILLRVPFEASLKNANVWPGANVGFGLVTAGITLLVWIFVMSQTGLRVSHRRALVGLLVSVWVTIAFYAFWQPIWGPGSDNADALEKGARRLLAGQNPYTVHTYLDGPLAPMIGGFLLAIPIVLVSTNVWLQGPIWLALGAKAVFDSAGAHAALAVSILFLWSPWTRLELPAQSDNWIVAAAIALTGSIGFRVCDPTRAAPRWMFYGSAALFAIALDYRFIYWLAVVPLAVLFVRSYGLKRSMRWFVPAGALSMTLILGPFAVNAQAYWAGPVEMGIAKGANSDFPYAGWVVAGASVLAIVVTSWRVRSLAGVWGALSLSLAIMTASIVLTKHNLGWSHAIGSYDATAYSGGWLILGLLALVLPTARDIRASNVATGTGAEPNPGAGEPDAGSQPGIRPLSL